MNEGGSIIDFANGTLGGKIHQGGVIKIQKKGEKRMRRRKSRKT